MFQTTMYDDKNCCISSEKPQQKWPVVQPTHVVKGKTNQDSARLLVDQLNTMKKLVEVVPEAEVEGPYNFKMLLRKTNILPTDSLRQRRQGNGQAFRGHEIMNIFGENKNRKENVEPIISLSDGEIIL